MFCHLMKNIVLHACTLQNAECIGICTIFTACDPTLQFLALIASWNSLRISIRYPRAMWWMTWWDRTISCIVQGRNQITWLSSSMFLLLGIAREPWTSTPLKSAWEDTTPLWCITRVRCVYSCILCTENMQHTTIIIYIHMLYAQSITHSTKDTSHAMVQILRVWNDCAIVIQPKAHLKTLIG